MIDETLIPLYHKPSHYDKTFYNQKSWYSINIQIINKSNYQIIDYVSGFWGSQYNTYYFKLIWLIKKPCEFLDQGEWYWGDQGYLLYKWLMILYILSASFLKENHTFNYHLSQICI